MNSTLDPQPDALKPEPNTLKLVIIQPNLGGTKVNISFTGIETEDLDLDITDSHRATVIQINRTVSVPTIHYVFFSPQDTPCAASLRGDASPSMVLRLAHFVRYLRQSKNMGDDDWNAVRTVEAIACSIAILGVADPTRDELDRAASTALQQENTENPDAKKMLFEALASECEPLRSALAGDLTYLTETDNKAAWLEHCCSSDIPVLDERFAVYLTKMGMPEYGDSVRFNGAERGKSPTTAFNLWIEGEVVSGKSSSPNALTTLALALWCTRVRELADRYARNLPAIVRQVHAPVAALFSNRARRDETKDGQRTLTLPGEVKFHVAHIDADTSRVFLERGITKLGSIAGIKLFRYLVKTGHERVFNNVADARLIRIEGGYQELARLIGSNRAPVRDIVEAFCSIELLISPTQSTLGLLTRTYGRATKNQPAMLEMVLGSALLPGYVFDSGLRGEQKQLVPIVEFLPGFVGRDNDHGAQAAASMATVGYFRERAEELADEGAVCIDQRRWDQLCDQAGVIRKLRSLVLERWQENKDDAPAFLCSTGKERFTLADVRANDFIKEGGTRQLIGAKNGRIAAAKRSSANISAAKRRPR